MESAGFCRQPFERQYTVNGDKLLKTRAVDDILKLGEAGESSDHKMTRGFNIKKPNRTADLVAAIEDDRHIWVKTLATVHDASAGTIFNITGSQVAFMGPDRQEGGDLRGFCPAGKEEGKGHPQQHHHYGRKSSVQAHTRDQMPDNAVA